MCVRGGFHVRNVRLCFFVCSFFLSFVGLFVSGSFGPSFLASRVSSFLRSFLRSFVRSFVRSFLRSLVRSLVRGRLSVRLSVRFPTICGVPGDSRNSPSYLGVRDSPVGLVTLVVLHAWTPGEFVPSRFDIKLYVMS